MNFADCPDVRIAAEEDEAELLRLMRLACAEDAQHPINEDKVRDVIRLHFDKRGGLIGVIGEKGGELCAYILMVVNEVWYSSEHHVQELSLFVAPDRRKSNYAKQLMAFGKHTAKGLHLDLTIGVLSNSRTEAKVRLYARQFPQCGAFFVYRPNSSEGA
jgi:GNAT superfamily N-acetyltransferase